MKRIAAHTVLILRSPHLRASRRMVARMAACMLPSFETPLSRLLRMRTVRVADAPEVSRLSFRTTRWLATMLSGHLRIAPRICGDAHRSLRHPALDDLAKHPPHLGLCFPDPRLERGEIRGVAGPRHHAQQVFARGLRLEPLADAQ